jgi:peptidoglycan/xylan/chitin deacetylase (PgdA/CDA1 family)
MKSVLKVINNGALKYFAKKPLNLSKFKERGCISFSFDDFPSSAVSTGMEILSEFGVRATFYTALGLEGQIEYGKNMFSSDELDIILKSEHEVGCHTFNHIDCAITDKEIIRAEMDKNVSMLKERDQQLIINSFAYPKGRAKPESKRLTRNRYVSSRTTQYGINYDGGDANLLKACSVYSRKFDLNKNRQLIKEVVDKGGWVIFYTHDVEESPSDFGCRPEELRSLIQLAVESGAWILPVGEVVAEL